MYPPYQRPLVWNGPYGFDPSYIARPQSTSRPPEWPVYPSQTVIPDTTAPHPSVQRLPAFNRGTDYKEATDDPSRPSDKKTLGVYRYRAAWDIDESKHSGWKHIQLDSDEEPSRHMREHPRVKLVSWNIDFESNWPCDRATALIDYLQKVICQCPETTSRPRVPCVIMLQEVHSKVLRDVIHKHDWIRNNFMLTPIDHDKWPLSWMHGCITLVERTVCVRDAYTINYAWSDQRRMAIGIEIGLWNASGVRRNMILLNTHLEDDIDEPVHHRHRKRQLNECRLQLIRKGFGGVLCASMSRFDGYDDLDDAYVYDKLGFVDAAGYENDEKSDTWGYQGGRGAEKCRPDKMLVLSPPQRNRKLLLARPKRIGVGLTFKDNRFVSDHFGLCATLEVE
ncbi:hypothetical protein CYLTODRAFT_76495 [Cylindrobasidium torrendii FP15055 ss-10]|uniref:Endonuclease/exonuclease/phosphatase domain-containing protein n=1 Tax=Cylindrobasidium torrendii FP15055 ss-10 TaxID=1314674 RepID=A0A0D7B4B8_9AGAR|nr:hypothetical protein CYLTODRAFT_76495 [Cylindrobasidium torrendii FP15055 ss-10]